MSYPKKRYLILTAMALIVALLIVMSFNLLSQLRRLSTAEGDDMRWTVSQLETEVANLEISLSEALASETITSADVRLRGDILLSRLSLVDAGRLGRLFDGDAEATALIQSIDTFASDIIAVIDQPGDLRRSDIENMRELARDLRPKARNLSLAAVRIGAAQAEERRLVFTRQLQAAGGMALFLLIAMGAMVLVFDRMLAAATRQDQAMQKTSKILTATVNASLDAIITANEDGVIVDYNSAAEEIFGWTRDEIIGLRMEDTIVPPKFRAAHHAGMNRYIRTSEPKVIDAGRIELHALRKTGEEFPVELSISAAQSEQGTVFISYLRDISDQKINEQNLIDARDRAERTDKAKSQFLGVMSHEMRTPLNGLIGVLDLLRKTELTELQNKYVRVATGSSEMMLAHINEALDITRAEAGAMTLTPAEFELEHLIQDVVDVLEPMAAQKNLQLVTKIDPPLNVRYMADGNRIRQVLINLTGNAIKFTNEGVVTLQASGIHAPGRTKLVITVQDTGPGIEEDKLDTIFEDYVVISQNSDQQTRGDGLGLPISRKIARLMGGDLTVTSEEGQGSSFEFVLSVERANTEPATRLPKAISDIPEDTQPLNVLIVEDNAINRLVLGDMLKRLGHTTEDAANGVLGVEAAAGRAFDVILMDINMPVLDGIGATQKIREGNGPNQNTPIVGLTAHGREEYKDAAMAAGMTGFHTKPIRLEALPSILARPERNEDVEPLDADDVDETVLGDLVGILGAEKATEIANRFFDEWSDALAHLVGIEEINDVDELQGLLHSNKGAASMIGMQKLSKHIEKVHAIVGLEDHESFRQEIKVLSQDLPHARARAFSAIASRAENDLT